MFTYKMEANDGMEWRAMPTPPSEADAVRQYQALLCNNVPARLTALSAHPLSRQERTMSYLLNVVSPNV